MIRVNEINRKCEYIDKNRVPRTSIFQAKTKEEKPAEDSKERIIKVGREP